MINDSLVELEVVKEKKGDKDNGQELISWLDELTTPWRDYRDTNFEKRWGEYYRLWRGIFK